jgi:hypothetical protein
MLSALFQLTTISAADIPSIAIMSGACLVYRLAMVYGVLSSLSRALKIKRHEKFIHRTFDTIHYAIATLVGIFALGNRSYGHCFVYARHCHDYFLQNPDGFVLTVLEKLYFYIFFCYYVVDFFFIWTGSEPYVYLVHHIVTLSEVACCVVLQSPVVGLSIMLLHDITDIPLYLAKFCVYIGVNSLAQVFLAIFVISTTYFRIFNYPAIVYLVYQVGWVTEIHQTLYRFQTVGLCVLYGMHLMWEAKIVKVAYRTIVGGTVADSRSDS